MNNLRVTWAGNPGEVTLTFQLEGDERTISVALGAAQVAELVRGFGLCRSQLIPEVERDLDYGQPTEAIDDPIIIPDLDVAGRPLLHVRDPRYGWLHYLLSRESAAGVGRLLQAQAQAHMPTQQSGKVN